MDYMEVLNKIIKAERTAQQIAEEAKTQRDNLPDDLRASWEEMHTRHLARAESRVQSVREQEERLADQKIEQLDAGLQDGLHKLEVYFRAHHDEMVQRLTSLVLDV